VLFYFRKNEEKGEITIQEFVASLDKNTRESDIKGWVDRDVVGLILPDTDEKGVKCCVEKIANGNGNLNYSVITGTYPDHLFVKLLMEEEGLPDLFPLDIDGPMESHGFQMALKRGMDILGSLAGLILFFPINACHSHCHKNDLSRPDHFQAIPNWQERVAVPVLQVPIHVLEYR